MLSVRYIQYDRLGEYVQVNVPHADRQSAREHFVRLAHEPNVGEVTLLLNGDVVISRLRLEV